MRPINKGPIPLENGVPKKVAEYGAWRQDLLDRLGYCCCYCNMPLTVSPQVEHVIPKVPKPGDDQGVLLDWENLILACGPCNRAKSNNPSSPQTHYLPESHNTHLAFDYQVYEHPLRDNEWMCLPVPANSSMVAAAKAKETIKLCGLDQVREHDPKAVDLRWHYRYLALKGAERFRAYWDKGPEDKAAFAELTMEAFRGLGFFSIWFNVFQDVPAIRHALIEAFPGTAANCFDQNANPIPRNGNDI
jgi:hypothetical protein